MIVRPVLTFAIILIAMVAKAADPVSGSTMLHDARSSAPLTIKGRVVPIDGRTLWFPSYAMAVRLAGIDSCELPQWAFDPGRSAVDAVRGLAPVPCGAIARAWLKRSVGTRAVVCDIGGQVADGTFFGICRAGSHDLGLGMLRVGWARLDRGSESIRNYASAQRYAQAARYGMWGTYLLEMDEWRTNAVDRTLDRRPHADIDLLRTRKAEITPPFIDAKRAPARTDR